MLTIFLGLKPKLSQTKLLEGISMTTTTAGTANQLRKNALGVGAITFMVVSAAAPLTGVVGALPFASRLEMVLGFQPRLFFAHC
jgi:hypothetical protein